MSLVCNSIHTLFTGMLVNFVLVRFYHLYWR